MVETRRLWRVIAGLLAASSLLLGYQALVSPASRPVAAANGEARAGDSAIAPPPAKFDAPPARTAAPPAALRSPFTSLTRGPGTWAVTIGINNYPGSNHDLRSATADADDVNRALQVEGVPADHIVSVRDTQASAAVIRLAAQWLVARAGPDSVAVFFYAGHARKLGPTSHAVVGADGNVVYDKELAALLAPLQARQTWIGMAACYGGGFDELLAPGRVLTGAANANSLAYENSAFGRSYMVEYMIRRAFLNHLASRSIQDAFGYASHHIAADYPNRVPVQFDRGTQLLSLSGALLGAIPSPVGPRTETDRGAGPGEGSSSPTTMPPDGPGDYGPGGATPPPSGPPTSSPSPPTTSCVTTVVGRVCH